MQSLWKARLKLENLILNSSMVQRKLNKDLPSVNSLLFIESIAFITIIYSVLLYYFRKGKFSWDFGLLICDTYLLVLLGFFIWLVSTLFRKSLLVLKLLNIMVYILCCVYMVSTVGGFNPY